MARIGGVVRTGFQVYRIGRVLGDCCAGGFFRTGRERDNRREAETCMPECLTGDASGRCVRRDAPVYGQGGGERVFAISS